MADSENTMKHPHEHDTAAGSPGASAPGEPGYEGEATIGDEGAAAGSLAFEDPFGRPDDMARIEQQADAVTGSEGEDGTAATIDGP